MPHTLYPESLLPWSDEKIVTLKDSSKKIVCTAVPTPFFWSLWAERKEEIKALSISAHKSEQGNWTVYWWIRDHVPPVVPKSKLPKWIAEKLRDYQIPIADSAVGGIKAHNAFLNASGLGTGKSFVALATCLVLKKSPFILSRKAAIPAWRGVAKHFGISPSTLHVINIEAIRGGKTIYGDWKKGDWNWTVPDNSLVIWDEVHNASGMNSKNSDMLVSIRDQNIPIMMLSATAANSPLKMKAIGYVLGLHEGADYYSWLYRHGCEKGTYGMEFNCGLDFRTRSGPGGYQLWMDAQNQMMLQIHNEIFKSGKGCFLSTADIPGFPEKQILPTSVDFGHQEEIDKIYKEMAWELADLKLTRSKDKSALTVMTEARRKTELLKVPGICDEVQEGLDEGMSVVVFVNYDDTVKALCERLKTNCRVVGWQTASERQRCIESFQANRDRVIIVNIQAGGESIGLHDLKGGHPRLSLITPSFWAENVIQASARTARDGAKTKSIIKILVAAGTVEEQVLENLNQKSARINTMNAGCLSDSDFALKV